MLDFDNEFVERRCASRMNVACTVQVCRPFSQKRHRETIRNLSTSGLKLETAKDLSLNDRYEFEFTLPDGPTLKLGGKVLWRYPKGQSIFYGIRFHEVGLLARIRLKFFFYRAIRIIRRNLLERDQ